MVFTLPICIRKEGGPGYPPSDLEVVKYFDSFAKENDSSYTAHIAVACFIAAAHGTMHRWLKEAQDNNVGSLHAYWHDQMEPSGARGFRNRFFLEVVTLAKSASHFGFWFAFYLKVPTAKATTPKFTAREKP